MAEKYYTVDQVAELYQVTRQAIYKWIRTGQLKAVRVGTLTRIRADDLKDFEQKIEVEEK